MSSIDEAKNTTISLLEHCVIIEQLKDKHRKEWNKVKRENLEYSYAYKNMKEELEKEKEAHSNTKGELERLKKRHEEQERHYQSVIKGYQILRGDTFNTKLSKVTSTKY